MVALKTTTPASNVLLQSFQLQEQPKEMRTRWGDTIALSDSLEFGSISGIILTCDHLRVNDMYTRVHKTTQRDAVSSHNGFQCVPKTGVIESYIINDDVRFWMLWE